MKFSNLTCVVSLLSALFLLYGCGGGGGSSSSSIDTEIGGKVIDGYVSGATVFLDLDFDGVQDASEPSSTTKNGGDYRLVITGNAKKCIGFAPIVVDVPVGAVDEEKGVVQKPYQMALPPDFEVITEADLMNVSPLTTVLWSSIEAALGDDITEMTCENLLESQSRLEVVKQILEASVSDVVTAHNISEDQIFNDYVAEDDAVAHDKAQEIVGALEKGFQETIELRELYPEADTARVVYHLLPISITGDLRTEAWFRNKVLSTESGASSSVERMSDDLSYVEELFISRESTYYRLGEFFISEATSIASEPSGYSCEKSEWTSDYTNSPDAIYRIYNVTTEIVSTPEECQFSEFEPDADTRHIFFESFVEDEPPYKAQFVFYRDGADDFPGPASWFDFKTNYENLLGQDLENFVENLPYEFDANDWDTGGADLWIKTKNYEEGDNQINVVKYSNGTVVRTTTHADGTWLKECSTDDLNWSECEADCCPNISIR